MNPRSSPWVCRGSAAFRYAENPRSARGSAVGLPRGSATWVCVGLQTTKPQVSPWVCRGSAVGRVCSYIYVPQGTDIRRPYGTAQPPARGTLREG